MSIPVQPLTYVPKSASEGCATVAHRSIVAKLSVIFVSKKKKPVNPTCVSLTGLSSIPWFQPAFRRLRLGMFEIGQSPDALNYYDAGTWSDDSELQAHAASTAVSSRASDSKPMYRWTDLTSRQAAQSPDVRQGIREWSFAP